jgi:hypothetical protein
MRPERGGSTRRLVGLITLGCLLGAATAAMAAGTPLVSAAPASADTCSAAVANVEGGRSSFHYGTNALVYVNTKATVNAYNNGFVRSLGVIVDNNNWVEVGWSAHIAGTTSPQVFAEWDNRGTPGAKNYKLVNYATDYGFTVDNVGHIEIFRFHFNGESSPFKYSPTMNFNTGQPIGNSERHNWCQSLWAHMSNLSDQISDHSWETWDDWNWCLNSSARNKHYIHKDSATELHVTATSPDFTTCV